MGCSGSKQAENSVQQGIVKEEPSIVESANITEKLEPALEVPKPAKTNSFDEQSELHSLGATSEPIETHIPMDIVIPEKNPAGETAPSQTGEVTIHLENEEKVSDLFLDEHAAQFIQLQEVNEVRANESEIELNKELISNDKLQIGQLYVLRSTEGAGLLGFCEGEVVTLKNINTDVKGCSLAVCKKDCSKHTDNTCFSGCGYCNDQHLVAHSISGSEQVAALDRVTKKYMGLFGCFFGEHNDQINSGVQPKKEERWVCFPQ